MEAFRTDYGSNKRVILGLDTIITGRLEAIFSFEGDCGLITDPFHPQQMCNGVGIFSLKKCAEIFTEWTKNLMDWKSRALYGGRLSEMKFLQLYLGNTPEALDRIHKDQIQSYKCHYLKNDEQKKARAKIVYFHGTPKPHQIKDLQEHWT